MSSISPACENIFKGICWQKYASIPSNAHSWDIALKAALPVNESGKTSLLDTTATPLVINAVSGSTADAGIRLCAQRRLVDEEMKTFSVKEI